MKSNLQNSPRVIQSRKHAVLTAMVGIAIGVMAAQAIAGTTGAEFQPFYTSIKGYASGYLGKGLAIAFFVGGVVWGFAKSTVGPALVGFAVALLLGLGPAVTDAMVSATI